MKRIVSLIVVILTINTIYCEIAINKVSMETLLEIPYGKSIRQLGKEYDYGGAEHQSITDIVITKDYFIFGDQWNNRFVKASHDLSDFIVLPNIDINTVSGFLEIKNNHLYNYDILSNSVFKYDLETNTMEFHSRSFLDGHTGLSTQKVIYWGSTIFEDLFIGEAKNNSFVVIDTKKKMRNLILYY
ncbi:hypothetical protein EW093_05535 [Thiospirochaeta perfilievii]|uniref:Uncharacterized protein n=1 Tax=Thiospirochaeta perfilievii TaxID=252967 RepID=A0A5C1Q9P1_9SPIO|nr:hypothetical protein [Thiospirochaeta perfilievii]QEN04187.1 hypothetical protein EW093_05535 [Thiospirochaeta perfilievii]